MSILFHGARKLDADGQVGMRGHPDMVQADERGGRKKN